jgi:hypothetical protein
MNEAMLHEASCIAAPVGIQVCAPAFGMQAA